MIVAIPSKGRPDGVKSQKVIPSARVYVPSVEVSDYQRFGVENLVAVPDEIRGITKTRNWILDHEKEEDRIVFVDDDVKTQGWQQMGEHSLKKRALSEKSWMSAWGRLFDVTEDMGYRIWGVSTEGSPISVHTFRPFIWHTYVTASCMGIRNSSGIRFDESFPVKEDYEMCLRCIKEDGGVVGARFLFWANSHWEDEGGCTEYRTQEMEGKAIGRLIEMYPGYIRKVERGGSKYSIYLDF